MQAHKNFIHRPLPPPCQYAPTHFFDLRIRPGRAIEKAPPPNLPGAVLLSIQCRGGGSSKKKVRVAGDFPQKYALITCPIKAAMWAGRYFDGDNAPLNLPAIKALTHEYAFYGHYLSPPAPVPGAFPSSGCDPLFKRLLCVGY